MRLRFLSSLLGALALLGYSTDVFHYVLVSHQYCASHGDFTHLESSHSKDHAASFDAAFEADESRAHSHSHCAVALERKRYTAPLVTAFSIDQVINARFVAPSSASAVWVKAVYRLAPKTSPPTA